MAARTACPAASSAACWTTTGTWLGHVFEHVAIELQNIAGEDVCLRQDAQHRPAGVYTVVTKYAQRIAAGELALTLLARCCRNCARRMRAEDWDWQSARDEYIHAALQAAARPFDGSLVKAAGERGIPWLRMNEQSLVAARPRQVAAAHPGDRHRAHQLSPSNWRGDREERRTRSSPPQGFAGAAAGTRAFGRASGDMAGGWATRSSFKPHNGNHGRGIRST